MSEREIPADELAEAKCPEGVIGGTCEPVCARCGRDMTTEYDELRRERDAARAEVERLREIAGGGRCVECGQVEPLTAEGLLAQHLDASTDEVCDGSGDRDHEPPNLTVRVLDNDDRKELARLRGQDAAASFVAQTWRALDPDVKDATDPTLADWLDALARAHEENDGGQDR